MIPYRIDLNIEGATVEDLSNGVIAARAFLDAAKVDVWFAAAASLEMEWADIDSTVTISDETIHNGSIYWEAIEVALRAACENLPNTDKTYEFSLLKPGQDPREFTQDSIGVIRPTTAYGRPIEELSAPRSGKRRVLVGINWAWA